MPEIKKVPLKHAPQVNSRRLALGTLGVAAFFLSYLLAGGESGLWVPATGIGIVLVAWLGFWILPWLAACTLVGGLLVDANLGLLRILLETAFLTGQIGLVWWTYYYLADGAQRLDDPRSATLFLILGPGFSELLPAALQAVLWRMLGYSEAGLMPLLGALWIARALGTLAFVPPLLVAATPWLVRARIVEGDGPKKTLAVSTPHDWTWGEAIETAGLAVGNCILAGLLVAAQIPEREAPFPLWGVSLLVVVWASLRQGLRGGALVAGLGACVTLTLATTLGSTPEGLSPLQGNPLAQCSTALLVGASAGWIRASEARYRQVVGHIPVVLYSAHLPRNLKVIPPKVGTMPSRSDPDLATGPRVLDQAEITLVSPAAARIYQCAPEEMLGPYKDWLQRILPADRDIVVAAVTQVCMQKQPVTCEYRLVPRGKPIHEEADRLMQEPQRWIRDTMVPVYTSDDLLAGWDGVVEDITEQQVLGLRLRRTSNMLQALVSNMPMGVFFVQGPMGQPILVNARARQLLGQREDVSAGIEHLPRVYRLYRPDGTLYPAEELPVARALRLGAPCSANDIVVHYPDGRRVPLISWAAAVDIAGTGKADAAVWLLEDMTALQQAESARRESETRLRAVIETMAEGMVIQNHVGVILDCNPAAAAILGTTHDQLVGKSGLGSEHGCLRADGSPFPRDQQPDLVTLTSGKPVRNVVLGVPLPHADNGQRRVRWILVNARPLPTSNWLAPHIRGAKLVTTFADITEHRQTLDSVREAKEKYQSLVETLPLMVLQFDAPGNLTYVNSAAESITGFSSSELYRPGFWLGLLVADERSQFQTALERTLAGYHARVEFRFKAKDGSTKVGLALMQPYLHEEAIQGTTCLIVDITMQRNLEAELQRAQQLELVGRLAGGTVHDFNNLLTVMVGLAQLAGDSIEAANPAREYLQHLTEAGEQASHLAGQILAFSKQRPSSGSVASLNAVVVHSLRMMRSVISPEIRIETSLAPDDPTIRGDEGQLKQVVMNLCLNARDAMPQGGKLILRTGRCPDPENPREEVVCLTIQDTGHGMDRATLARIFEPFFSTKQRGTGLGLTVVRQIIESFGGRIEVHSEALVGTRIDIYLMLAAEAREVRIHAR